jgi:hypothetical protein
MSNSFITSVVGSSIGIGLYYLLETAFYEVKYRLAGKRYENFLEDWEEEHVTF